MSRERIRRDITEAVELVKLAWLAANPGKNLVVEFDNNIVVDTQKQTDPFLCVNIKLIEASQRELSDRPHHRWIGQIELAAAVKEGGGTKVANEILDFFAPRLHKRKMGTVRTFMADVGPKRPHLGWAYYPMLVPFWSDQET